MDSVFFDPAKISMAGLNLRCENTMNSALGIVYTACGPDYLEAEMPVDERTIQPFGVLNGGASMGLIESLASMAGNLCIDPGKFIAVGQHISGHHIKSVVQGDKVTGRATPVHLGRNSQIWEVSIRNSEGKLICKGTMTLAVIPVIKNNG